MKGKLAFYIHSTNSSFEELKEAFEDERTTVEEQTMDKDQVSVIVSVELPYEEGEAQEAVDKYAKESAEDIEIFTFYDEQGETLLTEEDL